MAQVSAHDVTEKLCVWIQPGTFVIFCSLSFLISLHIKLFNEEKCHSGNICKNIAVSLRLAVSLNISAFRSSLNFGIFTIFSVGGETNHNQRHTVIDLLGFWKRHVNHAVTQSFKLAVADVWIPRQGCRENSGISFTSARQTGLLTPSLLVQFFYSFTSFLSATVLSGLWWFGKE